MRKARPLTSKRWHAYRMACRRQAAALWGYPELVDDHAERVAQAYRLKKSPRDFVRWLGEKFDLTSTEEWKGF